MSSRVGVVIPCYNQAAYLPAAVRSVLEQTYSNVELVLVNDGSTDATPDVLRSYQQDARVVLVNQKNQGVARARNAGCRRLSAESRYVLFLDADDVLEATMLERLTAILESRSSVGIVRCGYQFINEQGEPVFFDEKKFRYVPQGLGVGILAPEISETPFESVFTLCGMIPSICLLRRSVLDETGGFDEDFGHHHEDADLFIRMALRSGVYYLQDTLVRRRRHPGQNTFNSAEFRAKALSQTRKLYAKLLKGDGFSAEERGRIRKAWCFKEGRLEPYWALERARILWGQKDYLQSLRLLLGGARRYAGSFFMR